MRKISASMKWLSESMAVATFAVGLLFVGFSQSSFAQIQPTTTCKDQDPNTFRCPLNAVCPPAKDCQDDPVDINKCACL